MFGNDLRQYKLRSELATCSNGIGTVYLAEHKPSGQSVAVKRLRLDKTRLDNHILTDEILAMRQFHHAHILHVYAAFAVASGEVHVVMPLMCFGSCRDLLDHTFVTGLPEPLVALVLRDALLGLEYLHRRGIVHRSLRASHILVDRSRAVLCGFRECVSLLAGGERARTLHDLPGEAVNRSPHQSMAVPASRHLNWCAPEVLEQNVLGYTEKADVYSLGVTTCELANSLEPFADMPTTFMLTEKIRGNTPALLDCSTCPPPAASDSGVGDNLAETRKIYGARALTDNFHKFAELCMSRYPVERPTVGQLLGHAFLKQYRHVTLSEQLQQAGVETLHSTKLKDESVSLGCEFGDMSIQGTFEWDF